MSAFPISQNDEYLNNWRTTLSDELLKSPCTPVPVPDGTIIERILTSLRLHASKHPQKAALIEAFGQKRSLTYLQIHDRALSFAAFLTSRGFSIGDRVTLALPNSIEWPVVHLGTWAAGGSVVGAIWIDECAHQLRDSSSTVVVVPEQALHTIVEAAKQCPKVKMIICVRSSETALPEGVIDFEETLLYDPMGEIARVTPDSECMVYYSSGTTGIPKGVIHTHRTFHAALEMMRSHWLHEIYPVLLDGEPVELCEETQLVASCCYHISGFTYLNWFLITGCPVVLMKGFDGDVYLDSIEKFKPRQILVSPPIFAYLAKDNDGKNAALSSVQMIMCGGAPLSKELSDEFQISHANVKYIVQAYGMTEIGLCNLPLLLEEGVNAAAGVLSSYYEQQIVDPDTLKVCKQGQRGEVWVRGAPQTLGYLNDPEATKQLIDEQGWIHTGDIGYIDDRGLLYIVDRLKELIKVNYNNQTLPVAPAQIEGLLLSHSKIRDVAIVGITEALRVGELIRAFVVRADEQLTSEEVVRMVKDNLDEYQHITGGVYFVDDIPRALTGKLLRRELRAIKIA